MAVEGDDRTLPCCAKAARKLDDHIAFIAKLEDSSVKGKRRESSLRRVPSKSIAISFLMLIDVEQSDGILNPF
jgi:hypothetical protein